MGGKRCYFYYFEIILYLQLTAVSCFYTLGYIPCMQAILVNGPSLPAGTHYIPFSLNLPHGTPSTFEGEHGHVRCA